MKIVKYIKSPSRVTIFVILFSTLYLAGVAVLTNVKVEHWVIIGMYNLCYFMNPKTRKIILAFTIFVVFAMLYDLMKLYPNYLMNHVDISSLYHFEKKIFGFSYHNQLVTPNEFFATHNNTFLDILTGLFYINWIPVPMAFSLWLYIRNKELFLHFSLTFFLVNVIGFCIYYIHPAAPPWYVSLYGFELHMNVPGNTAGLARFDEFFKIPVFNSIYARNSNVFAAMPSLHCAYPVVVLFYALKSKMSWWVNGALGVFMAGIWFSAVYSGHHYVTDVIAGIFCAGLGILLFQKILLKMPKFQKWISKYKLLIS